jgi:hypothetical protein
MRIARGFVVVAVTLAGCSSGSAQDTARFTDACVASSNLEQSVCECSAAKAKQELSEKGFSFLVATLEKNESDAAALRSQLSPEEATSAGTFMTKAPADCAREAGQ